AQAGRTPEAPAVVCENQWLSYHELDQRANQLAHHLRALGVRPEILVGIYLERSVARMVGLLGILKAGGAYLPLERSYPPGRLAFMLEDAGAPVLVTDEALAATLPAVVAEGGVEVVRLDRDAAAIAGRSGRRRPAGAHPSDQLAYVIYTSGSTGRPKGVGISHRAILNRLLWMQEAYGLRPGEGVLHKTPVGFDVSVWELFWPLITGARMVLARPGGHRDPVYLAKLIADEQVGTLHFVPSMLQAFLAAAPDLGGCTGLRRVIASGEALTPELRDRFF
ncbi:MAG: AMP-binding protein, partial [bacterium]|nr:AMP-binding protein [bacterium]